ncbi:Dyp-type peroxidase [Massarina eburnea CBS 473.64]|uniref:Dyp-type peroxidase n=1 Tax=Massarina eburnea CBS 473.64 TaxID=1395130 RepID=A0A6A6S4I5_9PLEO|nr:Dyp-type peroxidase [Massarina eburnea CBS 473.64]
MAVAPLSLANVQGDILFGLPKQTESFFFFQINQADAFQTSLANLVPLITTAEQTKGNIETIRTFKINNSILPTQGDGETVHPDVVSVNGVNIAFSAKGLQKLNINPDGLNESLFTRGMRNGSEQLGDLGNGTGSNFVPKWEDVFLGEIHGVVLVAGNNRSTVSDRLADVKDIFKDSVKEISTVIGDVRPDDQQGHEHFGYKDGVSNPAIKDVDGPFNLGQTVVDQGIALFGRDNDTTIRSDWSLDGSFMAFRKLPQKVPEFDKYVPSSFLVITTAGTQEAADLMGARFVGRWKSGAPIETNPTKDDPALGADPARNNNFTFPPKDQSKCPFAAHIRKMNPRGDINEASIIPHMVLRRGIPFGPEVSAEEKATNTTIQERGLLFVCYQTSITNGFKFLQQAWANNPNFPEFEPIQSGFDPIIGQNNTGGLGPRFMTGAFAANVSQPLNLAAQWVDTSGGEYFFSPSIPTLRDVLARNGTVSR